MSKTFVNSWAVGGPSRRPHSMCVRDCKSRSEVVSRTRDKILLTTRGHRRLKIPLFQDSTPVFPSDPQGRQPLFFLSSKDLWAKLEIIYFVSGKLSPQTRPKSTQDKSLTGHPCLDSVRTSTDQILPPEGGRTNTRSVITLTSTRTGVRRTETPLTVSRTGNSLEYLLSQTEGLMFVTNEVTSGKMNRGTPDTLLQSPGVYYT